MSGYERRRASTYEDLYASPPGDPPEDWTTLAILDVVGGQWRPPPEQDPATAWRPRLASGWLPVDEFLRERR